ncbi:MAG: hypothetical protein ACYDG5_06895 [Dehalococcoidales bacterium]
MEAALCQHLPHSPIWSYMSKWRSLHPKSDEQLQKIGSIIEQAAKEHPKLTPLVNAGLHGIIPGIVSALSAQASRWSHGYKGLNTKENLLTEPAGEGLVNLRYGGWEMGKMDNKYAGKYKEIMREVLDELQPGLKGWEAYRDLEKTVTEIGRLGDKLREELADETTAAGYVSDLHNLLNESSLAERKSFVRSFIKEVKVTGDNVLLTYTIPMLPGGIIEENLPVLSIVHYGGR